MFCVRSIRVFGVPNLQVGQLIHVTVAYMSTLLFMIS